VKSALPLKATSVNIMQVQRAKAPRGLELTTANLHADPGSVVAGARIRRRDVLGGLIHEYELSCISWIARLRAFIDDPGLVRHRLRASAAQHGRRGPALAGRDGLVHKGAERGRAPIPVVQSYRPCAEQRRACLQICGNPKRVPTGAPRPGCPGTARRRDRHHAGRRGPG
jgi:hypothetical protein